MYANRGAKVQTRKRRSEAVQGTLLLVLFVAVVQSLHAGLEVGTLGLNTQPGITFFFHCLEGVACHATLLSHHAQLFFKTGTFLPPGIQVILRFLTGRFQVGQRVFKCSGKLLLRKQMFLNGSNTRLLVFDELRLRNVLALMTRSRG